MEDLRAWLDNPSRDYYQGVELYQKYGDDVRLKVRVFPAGPLGNNKKLLDYELHKIYHSQMPKVQFGKKSPKKSEQKQEEPKKTSIPDKTADPPAKVPIPLGPDGYLRKEFPKINYETLPDPLKVLVVDRIALFNKARDAREKMMAAENDDERGKWSIIHTESMIANKAIWNELNHFNESGQILGEHPIFLKMKEVEKLKKLSREQLFKKKTHFPSAISKANKAIREAGDNEEIIARQKVLLEKYKWQEEEVDRLLGL